MRKTFATSFIAILSVGLIGCDTIYGISSDKFVMKTADDECVVGALRQTPGIVNVRTQTIVNADRIIAGEGPVYGSPIRYFSYDIGADFYPTLTIANYGAGKYRFSDSMLSINKRIPQTLMSKALPIMLDAEKRVSRNCGIDIDINMRHECDGTTCGLE
jgi:hypothetical protein